MKDLERLKKLQKILVKSNCDALIIHDKINLFYLTGLELSAGKLFVGKHSAHLIVDGRYIEACKKNSPYPVKLDEKETLNKILQEEPYAGIKTLGFDSGTTSFKQFIEMENWIDQFNKAAKRKIELLALESPIEQLRMIKDESEKNLLRQAAELGSLGYDFVCSILKEGITEQEVATELEIFWKRKGGKKLAFDPIIAFGPNTSMPHYRPGQDKLKKGQPVLIDIGVNLENYHSDMTRVVFYGKPDPRIEEIYDIVKTAQEKALALCQPGVKIGDVDAAARSYIEEKGYGSFFSHGLGHGIGLEIHEIPYLRQKPPYRDMLLEVGMAVTIEPGIYLPDIGGVRIEDTILITPQKYENLTKRDKNIKIIE